MHCKLNISFKLTRKSCNINYTNILYGVGGIVGNRKIHLSV